MIVRLSENLSVLAKNKKFYQNNYHRLSLSCHFLTSIMWHNVSTKISSLKVFYNLNDFHFYEKHVEASITIKTLKSEQDVDRFWVKFDFLPE